MLGCLGFVTVIAGLRVRLTEAAGRTSQLPMLALVGAGMAAVCGMLTAGVDLAGGIDKNDITPAIAAVFHHSVDIFFVGAELAAVLPLAAVAILAWRTRVLPRWWAAFGGLAGGGARCGGVRAGVARRGPVGLARLVLGGPAWDPGHNPLRAVGLARAHAGGRCGRLRREDGGALRGRRASEPR